MKNILVVLCCTLFCNLSLAAEVTATGYGRTSDEALQNAKVLATEYAASTFLTGKQEFSNGKYKESLGQYNGGLVQKYVVQKTIINSMGYEITILADVNTDKVNEIITNGDTASNTIIPQVEKALNETHKVQAAWSAISKASDPFVFAVDSTKYEIDGDNIQLTYHLHLKWNPKWVDDSVQLARAINHPVDETTKRAICWHRTKQKNIVCSDVGVLPMEQLYSRLKFNGTVHFTDGSTELLTYERAFATASPGLYVYNKWFHISATDESTSCGGPLATGLSRLFFLLLNDKCFKYYEVDSVIIYPDNVSLFDFNYRTTVQQFKTIKELTFAPEW